MTRDWTPQSFEALFDSFIETQPRAQRLEQFLTSQIPDGTGNADYVFDKENILVELKVLSKDHGSTELILSHAKAGLKKYGFPHVRLADWRNGKRPLPQKVSRFVDQRVKNALNQAVRKANKQLWESKKLLQSEGEFDGILIVANLRETLFGPAELLKYLAGSSLQRSSSAIDAILLITPGVTYSTPGTDARHYIMQTFREGKTGLSDFLEPLTQQWLEFEANSLGLRADVEKSYELDEETKRARPVKT